MNDHKDADEGRRFLQSWKEIAGYLGVSTRTAQTWEKEQGLPVYRAGQKELPRVYAVPEEIDEWLLGVGQQDSEEEPGPRSASLLSLEEPGQILVQIGGRDAVSIIYKLTRSLAVKDLRASDSYVSAHGRVFEEGRLDHPFDSSELSRYRKLFRVSGRNPNGNSQELADFFEE